jgi:hypothetical protein
VWFNFQGGFGFACLCVEIAACLQLLFLSFCVLQLFSVIFASKKNNQYLTNTLKKHKTIKISRKPKLNQLATTQESDGKVKPD